MRDDEGNKPYDHHQADDNGDDPEHAPWEYPMVEEEHRKFDSRSTDGKDKTRREVCLTRHQSAKRVKCKIFCKRGGVKSDHISESSRSVKQRCMCNIGEDQSLG